MSVPVPDEEPELAYDPNSPGTLRGQIATLLNQRKMMAVTIRILVSRLHQYEEGATLLTKEELQKFDQSPLYIEEVPKRDGYTIRITEEEHERDSESGNQAQLRDGSQIALFGREV